MLVKTAKRSNELTFPMHSQTMIFLMIVLDIRHNLPTRNLFHLRVYPLPSGRVSLFSGGKLLLKRFYNCNCNSNLCWASAFSKEKERQQLEKCVY